MQYWQIGNGNGERDYSNVFFNFGVALVGPGNYGRYPENKERYQDLKGAIKKISPLHEIAIGDRIVLRHGRRKILAVGEVTGGYDYSNLFCDIDGWDLQHFVRVSWKDIRKNFQKSVLAEDTLVRVGKPEVKDFINKSWANAKRIRKKYDIEKIPIPDVYLTDKDIEGSLINNGLPVELAENMTRTIARVRKVSEWYMQTDNQYASEHEIRTFLVIPFLQSLGWPAQRIGIEVPSGSQRLDVVLYADPKRKTPIALIETKKIWIGLEQAIYQLEGYSKKYSSLKYLITTTGLRYALYENTGGKWKQTAYMNFSKMLEKHPCYPDINGVYHLLEKLLP